MQESYDAVVVGSGANGLIAGTRLLQAGRSVLVLEAAAQPGGCLRSAELLESGFRHDICASVMALATVSPALEELSLDLVRPPAPLAHPLDDGTAVVVEHSLDETASGLGVDAAIYRLLVGPPVRHADRFFAEILQPLLHVPRAPLLLTRFGLTALPPAYHLARLVFRTERARALFAGAAAHAMLSLREPVSSAFGVIMLASAHVGGWPFMRGGSGALAELLTERFQRLGGELRCGTPVEALSSLPSGTVLMLDLSPTGVTRIAGDQLPKRYLQKLDRYRYGPGAFKIDWTLNGTVPWRAEACLRAGTIHVGGSLEEISAAEEEVARGGHPERPFVLVTQASLFDDTRAPQGKQVLWAYCHVPNGSSRDMTNEIERQIERFAPGFRDLIRERKTWTSRELEQQEPNCIGGDVNVGRQDYRQLLARPVLSLNPYRTPNPRILLCSAATPPGGGVHGMCGWHAVGQLLRNQ